MNEIIQKFGNFSPSIFLFYFTISFLTWYLANYFFKKKIKDYLNYNNELQENINLASIQEDDVFDLYPESVKNYYEKKEAEDLKFGVNKIVGQQNLTQIVENNSNLNQVHLDGNINNEEIEKNDLLENSSLKDTKFENIHFGKETDKVEFKNVEIENKITEFFDLNSEIKEEKNPIIELQNEKIETIESIPDNLINQEILKVDESKFELLPINEVLDRSKSTIKAIEKPVVIDDLKLIEGIGFKIQEILNSKGIYSFYELSLTDSHQIKSYLEEAGPRFAFHDPKTWQKQAALARDGEWPALRRLQDELDKGKEVK